jgi:hypothetical protein
VNHEVKTTYTAKDMEEHKRNFPYTVGDMAVLERTYELLREADKAARTSEVEAHVAAERKNWITAVNDELHSNGLARSIILNATDKSL